MNERLPYEEQVAQQLTDLPLPDENHAWDDMKRRLEEDDDSGIIPIWLRGCGPWALGALLLLAIGWWIIRPEKWWNKKQETESITTNNKKENKNNIVTGIKTGDTTRITKPNNEKKSNDKSGETLTITSIDSSLTTVNKRPKKSLQKKNAEVLVETIDPGTKKKKESKQSQTIKSGSVKTKQRVNKNQDNQIEPGQIDISIERANKKKDTSSLVEINTRPVISNKDSASVTTIPAGKKDSVAKINPVDSIATKTDEPIVKTNEPKKDSSKPKTISFSAGVAMHQLLPVDGQKPAPYSSQGRKSSLADYIPSVFARMYKNDKWFIQLEFRYGAPQYTKNLLYSQQSVLDTNGGVNFTRITSQNLKKTFYHQIPLSFNYFVLPNWSLGSGIVWNKFYSAISEEEINRKNNITQADSIISKKILATRNDTSSAFSKSYFQLLFETQYRWRRFSIGARYSFGLQPYIKFNLNGANQEERNRSLQVFLRYELWKSKLKR
jgi:hypothetical protein